jgi:uncharacterized membrane protein HdeD (DUF308 family)
LFSGIFNVNNGIGAWFLKILLAVIQLGVGVYLLRHPHVTFATFILLIGFTLIFRGIMEITMAFMGSQSGGSRALLLIAGGLAMLAGIVILYQPVTAGVAFVWILGLYALLTGPIIIAAALSERNSTPKLATR